MGKDPHTPTEVPPHDELVPLVETDGETDEAPAVTMPLLVMPGPAGEIGTEVAQIGVEGVPADAKSGPGTLFLTLAGLVVLLVVAGVLEGFFDDWDTGIALIAIGLLGLVANPVVAATLLRARDRQDVADHHTIQPHPISGPRWGHGGDPGGDST